VTNQNFFVQFRSGVYQNFGGCKRTDSLMDLVDALSSNARAKSPVELTLNVHFRRSYTALNKAVRVNCLDKNRLAQLASKAIIERKARKCYLFGSDVTSNPRPYAETLADRSYVYQPNTIKGNKPIAVGHQYSFLAMFPEREQANAGHWVIPMAMDRVKSQENKELVGARQMRDILADEMLPFGEAMCVQVVDASYSKPSFLRYNADKANLVVIARARGSRTFYRQPKLEALNTGEKGHPTWYGSRFSLQDPETWGQPDETAETRYTSLKKKTYRVELQNWHNLIMRGKKGISMREHPFTLVKVCWYDQDGKQVFQKPLWLIVLGAQRTNLNLLDIFQAYQQRYDLEHFFRFGKQKLLLDKFQTPDDQHEENWWRLSALAYLQLWAARELTNSLPRPWERNLPSALNKLLTPSAVLRDMDRIIRQCGTLAPAPKPRGKSPGWKKGKPRNSRPQLPVLKKGKS
jgi:hypothetical protein